MKPSVQEMNPKTRQAQISENYFRKIMKYLFLVGGSLILGLGFLLVLGTMLAGGLPEETGLRILMVVGGLLLLYKGSKKKNF